VRRRLDVVTSRGVRDIRAAFAGVLDAECWL
jgi:hypothetical protein